MRLDLVTTFSLAGESDIDEPEAAFIVLVDRRGRRSLMPIRDHLQRAQSRTNILPFGRRDASFTSGTLH